MNTPKPPQPIIIARNVDKRFGSFYALRGVSASFSVSPKPKSCANISRARCIIRHKR